MGAVDRREEKWKKETFDSGGLLGELLHLPLCDPPSSRRARRARKEGARPPCPAAAQGVHTWSLDRSSGRIDKKNACFTLGNEVGNEAAWPRGAWGGKGGGSGGGVGRDGWWWRGAAGAELGGNTAPVVGKGGGGEGRRERGRRGTSGSVGKKPGTKLQISTCDKNYGTEGILYSSLTY